MEKCNIIGKKRNIGLDILRITSMLMILVLHYLGKGQLLNDENVDGINYYLFYFMESFAIVAVNCYVLISGYFLVESKFKLSKVAKIWGETIFYSISIYILIIIANAEKFNLKDAIKSFFPIITNQYWFVYIYIVLYLLTPFINKLVQVLNKKEYKKMLIILFTFFSLTSFLPSQMLLDRTGGYSIIWFVFLYLVAGYIRIHVDIEQIKKDRKKYLYNYIILSIITTIIIQIAQKVVTVLNIQYPSDKFWNYNMPLVFISSVCLFLYCVNIEINGLKIKRLILNIAPLTFAVYIIHEQPVFSRILYKKILHTDICYHNPYGIFCVIISVLIVFMICISIEYIRVKMLKTIKEYVNNYKGGKNGISTKEDE